MWLNRIAGPWFWKSLYYLYATYCKNEWGSNEDGTDLFFEKGFMVFTGKKAFPVHTELSLKLLSVKQILLTFFSREFNLIIVSSNSCTQLQHDKIKPNIEWDWTHPSMLGCLKMR